jgi:hypothetical protein
MNGLDRRALAAFVATVALVAAMVPLAAGREEAFDTVLYTTLPLTLALTGTLIASRHPGNPIGWLFCGMAVWGGVTELGEAYGYVAADHGLPGGAAGEWLVSWSWIVELLGWLAVVLLFPDGQLPGRRWRLALWTGLAGAARDRISRSPRRRWLWRRCSGRPARVSRPPWIGVSTGAGTTPPARSSASGSGCATKWIWTLWPARCAES